MTPDTSCVKAVVAELGDSSREQLIPLLQEIQSREGFVSHAAMSDLAAALNTPVASVYGVATFYNQFRFAPLGQHVIEVCQGTACHVKQSLTLYQHLQRHLKLRPDGNSPDGRFTVISVACLGACSIAPVIKLDGEFYGHLTVDSLNTLLAGLDDTTAVANTSATQETLTAEPQAEAELS
ncbi:MAG: NAD(P)H-dependent oxidoreductase subunit E [Thermoleophilia bacterium]|jgi:NADH-quinone oxidoreductase subunit E